SPAAAAEAALKKYQMQQIESKATTVNGLPAHMLIAEVPAQPDQQQPAIRTLSYFIQYDGKMYSIMGISAAQDFNSYSPKFTQVATSFAPLTDTEKLNREPDRIKIETVAQRRTLGQVLKGYQVPEARLEELAILNGMQLDENVDKGTLIKTIKR
nr:peptidase M48 [Bacteroidota bacterium]